MSAIILACRQLVRSTEWERHRRVALQSAALVVHARLERNDGAINLVAHRIQPLRIATTTRSRDCR